MAVSVRLAACRWQRNPKQKSSLLEVLDNDKVVMRKMISLQAVRKELHSICIPTNPACSGVQKFVYPFKQVGELQKFVYLKDKVDFKQVCGEQVTDYTCFYPQYYYSFGKKLVNS